MIVYSGIAFAIILLVVGVVFYLRVREKNRKRLFHIILNLANEEMESGLSRMSVDAVQQRYEKIKATIEKLFATARSEREFALCKQFEKKLSEWRVQKIQEIYNQRLKVLLDRIRSEANPRKRLSLLYQARDLIKEGVLDDESLKKVDKWIVYTHIKQVRHKERGLPLEMKYHLYEEAITEILNSGIEDSELEAMSEFKEFITDFEIMYKQLKKSEDAHD